MTKPDQAGEMRRNGMTYRQICQALGISIATAYSYVFKAGGTRGQLEHKLEEETPREARARIDADLASGRRCGAPLGMGVCCLLNPCADHEAA